MALARFKTAELVTQTGRSPEEALTLPELLAGRLPPWWDDAGCRGSEVDFFANDASPALAVCAACRVRPECADWAITLGIGHGVFGGLTADERRRTRRAGQRGKRRRTGALARPRRR